MRLDSKCGVGCGAMPDQPRLLVRTGGQCTSTGYERRANGFRGNRGVGDIGRGCAKITTDSPRKYGATMHDKWTRGARGGIITFACPKKHLEKGGNLFRTFLVIRFVFLLGKFSVLSPNGFQIWSFGKGDVGQDLVGQASTYRNVARKPNRPKSHIPIIPFIRRNPIYRSAQLQRFNPRVYSYLDIMV